MHTKIDHAAETQRMHERIGAAFACAFIAYMSSTRYQTVEKELRGQPPSAYWIQLAEQVTADYSAGRFGSSGPGE